MSKAILISIKPKYVAKILNGEKTIEIRKTMPKCDLPIDVYIYATKEEKLYDDYPNMANGRFKHNKVYKGEHNISGKVVAKFTLNKCQEWHNYSWQTITKCGCVSDNELREYSKYHKSLYIWHISNLVIFDRPKELSEFKCCAEKTCVYGKCHEYMHCLKTLTKAPQSWCYVEV